MSSRRALPWLLVAVTVAASLAAAQAAPPAYVADATLYLHRDAGLTADAPLAADDAVATFGSTALAFRFESPVLLQPWALRGDATFRTTFRTTVDLLGRVSATLDVDGEPFANSTTADLLPDFRPREVALHFSGLTGTLPVGSVVGLTLQVEPAVQVRPGPGSAPVAASDLMVEMLYDSAAHPSRLEVLGIGDASGPGTSGPPGAPGPKGPAGTSPGNTTIANNTGNGGPGGGDGGDGGNLGEPLAALGTADVDPFLVMAGIGTSTIVVLGGLAIRGRQGLG